MRGTCHALFAHDIGFAVNLDHAMRLVTQGAARESLRHAHRAPSWFDYTPAPLRIQVKDEPIRVGGFETSATVECLVFDFGTLSVSYSIPVEGSLDDLASLAEALYENQALLAAARRRAEWVLDILRPAVREPGVMALVEDYCIYHLGAPAPPGQLDAWMREHELQLAQILRSDRRELSRQEVEDALARPVSYSSADAALIDWNAAILFLDDAADARAVLEFANVELLEMRFVDERLDEAFDRAYELLTRRQRWWHAFALGGAGAELRRIGRLQADAALLFEGVNSALKLLGDQYLARISRRAAERFHLPEWDASILRKISALESIYQKFSDRTASQRMEALEWIIIVLIAMSLVLPWVSPS